MEATVLQTLANQPILNTLEFAQQHGFDHNDLVGVIKSLTADNFTVEVPHERLFWQVTPEGAQYVDQGSPEWQVFNFIKQTGGCTMQQLQEALPNVTKIGFAAAMKQKLIQLDKNTKIISPAVEDFTDLTQQQLALVQQGNEIQDYKGLKQRKLIDQFRQVYFEIHQGTDFNVVRVKPEAFLTTEMLNSKKWKETKFKQFNVEAKGKVPNGGHLHPLLKLRAEFRRILLEMGFEEMPTNNFIESSFWNFDSLFQPQQHPARDAHDTFFIKDPEFAQNYPEDYCQRVKEMHENGFEQSIGWRYDWDVKEAQKNILRTHTTAVSSRMLYKLAQDGFQPKRYFSIDRVFRNEAVDATHLAEFHQIEGLVADRNLGLADLIGVITEFFRRIGITELKYKPAYNPYTEPSMEIFGYHPILKRWTEIGNSGIFRPEMLLPMGLPPDVSVIAWGLSLERPAMIQYGIKNIRDLFGHKIDLGKIKQIPITRYN